MKRAQPACVRVCSFLLVMLFFTSATRAQFSRLDDLASQLAKKLKPVKPQLVAVADFRAPYGSDMPQEHYFAWLLSDDLRILVITSSEAQLVLRRALAHCSLTAFPNL